MLAFDLAVDYGVGASPQSVVTADFDNDGRMDVATANSGSNSVSVLLGNGNGTFQPARDSAAGTWPLSLAVGDFNNDGNLDLVTRNYNGSTQSLNLLLGSGNGTFQSPRSTPNFLGNTPAIGDVNADGMLDLVTTTNESLNGLWHGLISTRLGSGDGTFAAPTTQLLGSSDLGMDGVLHDFNADGKLDLATDGVRVLAGNGDGTFAAPVDYAANGDSITAGDINGDGISDLITQRGNTAGVLLGNGAGGVGDGTFQPAQSITLFQPPQDITLTVFPNRLALGDFNADGHLDLVATSVEARYASEQGPPVTWTGRVHVLLGYGDGTFAAPRTSTIRDSRLFASATGDFNGDGFSDAAVTSLESSSVKVLLDNGNWPLSVSVDDIAVTEGNAGANNAVFTVRLSSNPAQTVTVNYGTVNISATAGSDYVATSGTLTFQPGGSLSQTVTVPVLGDTLAETEGFVPIRQESFRMIVTDPTGAASTGVGIGTIRDDEPQVSLDGYTIVVEGDVGITDAVLPLNLSAPSSFPVTVEYATFEDAPFDDPATAGSDYVPATGTVTFAPGTTTQTLTVKVLGDTIPEGYFGGGAEVFGVKLITSPQAHIPVDLWQRAAQVVIVDDDASVSVSHAAVSEGNAGTVNAVFWVTLSSARSQPVTVSYATADGTAPAGSDYQAASGTLTFAPGETSKTDHRAGQRRPPRRAERDLLRQPEQPDQRDHRRRPGRRAPSSTTSRGSASAT